jgi:hypothetical protein
MSGAFAKQAPQGTGSKVLDTKAVETAMNQLLDQRADDARMQQILGCLRDRGYVAVKENDRKINILQEQSLLGELWRIAAGSHSSEPERIGGIFLNGRERCAVATNGKEHWRKMRDVRTVLRGNGIEVSPFMDDEMDHRKGSDIFK